MRRGLISWSKEEVPVAVLEDRVRRLQAVMKTEQLGLVLGYTSFAQPAAAHWICNFIPYWSEALIAVLPEGQPFLLASLTKRVHPWMREVSHVGDVVSAPKLGAAAASLIRERVPPAQRIGVIGLDELSWAVMQPIAQAGLADRLVDIGALFEGLRQPADETETGLARQAARIAQDALRSVPREARQASDVTSAIERSARLAGAEEVLQRIAPDLKNGSTLQRMEGDAPLGERYAIEVSVAYKGAWVRWAETRTTGHATAGDAEAQSWFERTLAQLTRDGLAQPLPTAPGSLSGWTLEACTGMHPLTVIAASDLDRRASIPAKSLAVFTAELSLPDGAWRASAPVRVAAPGTSSFTAPV